MKTFRETRIVTRDFARDWLQNIKNLFGFRLTQYEEKINENIDEMIGEVKKKGNIKWYRIEHAVEGGMFSIIIYGELE